MRDETPQRVAPVGVKADVMQELAFAPRRAGAGEVERPQTAGGDDGADRLDDIGIVLFLGARDRGRERRDVDGGVGQRDEAGADRCALDGRQIALNIDDDVVFAGGVDRAQRLEDPVRAGG